MNRLNHRLAFSLAAIGIAAVATAAQADSRMFGARSSQAGVAIVGAVANGAQLAVAGQGGGVTFFRIDNPGGTVPCANRVAFTGSNGAVVTVDADICANGGQLTVVFGAAAAPVPPPPAVPPAAQAPAQVPLPLPGGGQAVTISTDDPNVGIDAVFLSGREVPISRRVGNGVEIGLPPATVGPACIRDLGLALTDGRRIARDADVCSGNGQVVVQLIGPGGPAAPPPPVQPFPPPQPTVLGGQWIFSSEGGNARLIFGIPNTDAMEFNASCAVGSGSVTVTLDHGAPEVRPGVPVKVGFAAGAFNRSYSATGSEISQMTGASSAVLQLTVSDTLWTALIRESFLGIQIGSSAPYGIALVGSAAATRQFLAQCAPQTVQPAPPPFAAGQPPVPGAGVDGGSGPLPITYGCDDGSEIYVTFYDDEDAALVAEPNMPPRYLRRQPSTSGVRYASGGSQLVGRETDITWQRAGGFPMRCQPR